MFLKKNGFDWNFIEFRMVLKFEKDRISDEGGHARHSYADNLDGLYFVPPRGGDEMVRIQ